MGWNNTPYILSTYFQWFGSLGVKKESLYVFLSNVMHSLAIAISQATNKKVVRKIY